jgi:hypothetical protein
VLLLLLLVVSGCVIYAGATATLASLAANLDVAQGSFEAWIDTLKAFFIRHDIPPSLQTNILDYYQNLWLTHKV